MKQIFWDEKWNMIKYDNLEILTNLYTTSFW